MYLAIVEGLVSIQEKLCSDFEHGITLHGRVWFIGFSFMCNDNYFAVFVCCDILVFLYDLALMPNMAFPAL